MEIPVILFKSVFLFCAYQKCLLLDVVAYKMEHRNDQIMNEDGPLLTLNNDCFMQIFQHLSLVDFVNFASTCSKLLDVARDFRSQNYINVEIDKPGKASKKILSKHEYLTVLSVIGVNVLEINVNNSSTFMLETVKENCNNLKKVCVTEYNGSQILQGFRNLEELKVDSLCYISINEWINFFICNPELEVLDFYGGYEDGFMELLTHLPKLQSLALPYISSFIHERQDFQHLLQLRGLTKLLLRSGYNLNGMLIDLANNMNLVELDIRMKFDNKSFEILNMFRNLEILSIDSTVDWNGAWFPNALVFPPRLQRLKMKNIQIWWGKLLEIVQQLIFLKEFDLGEEGEIWWDNNSKPTIDNILIRNRRKLRILCNDLENFQVSEMFDARSFFDLSFFIRPLVPVGSSAVHKELLC